MSVDVVVIVDDDDDLQVNYNSGERCTIKEWKMIYRNLMRCYVITRISQPHRYVESDFSRGSNGIQDMTCSLLRDGRSRE